MPGGFYYYMRGVLVAGRKILVFEDDQFVAMAVNDVLSYAGYSVSIFEKGGAGAKKIVMDANPDLIIMDMKLANNTDGLTTARLISEISDTPIVFMSAFAKEIDQADLKNANFFAILEKPFNKNRLLNVVKMVFGD